MRDSTRLKQLSIVCLLLVVAAILPAQRLSVVAVVDIEQVVETIAAERENQAENEAESDDSRNQIPQSLQQFNTPAQARNQEGNQNEELREQVRETVTDIAESEGYHVVIPASQPGLQWWSPEVDITSRVIEEFLGEDGNSSQLPD